MKKKKKSLWSVLNPLEWINAALQILTAISAPLLRWLGMLAPPSTEGFQNTPVADVEDAAKLAEEQEAAAEALIRKMSPAEVVRAYARADAAGRATMDLQALGMDEQDWLMRLSDEDLAKLSMLTTNGCARSLEAKKVLPLYRKPPAEAETPEIYQIPSAEDEEEWKRQQVAAQFRQAQRELWLAPGIPNPKPKHTPATLH